MKKDFRCSHCKQLQLKYTIDNTFLKIEVKCYACNSFSTFSIRLNNIMSDDKLIKKIDIAQ